MELYKPISDLVFHNFNFFSLFGTSSKAKKCAVTEKKINAFVKTDQSTTKCFHYLDKFLTLHGLGY